MYKQIISLFCCYLLFPLLACQSSPPLLDHGGLKSEILRLTNQIRSAKNLAPLRALKGLDQVSFKHSQDMAKRDFFEHINPEGQEPYQRLNSGAPELFWIRSGENIALQTQDGMNTQELAEKLVTLWKESPEHYAHLISPQFWQLGIGIASQEDKIYATQTFAAVLAKLNHALLPKVQAGEIVELKFEFLGAFPASELQAFLYTPNPEARIPAEDGSSYIGKGPIPIVWNDAQNFKLSISTAYGAGTYTLRLGRNGEYFERDLSFEAQEE